VGGSGRSLRNKVQNWPRKGVFPILGGGSRSRGTQTGRLSHESRAHLLRPTAQPGSGWPSHLKQEIAAIVEPSRGKKRLQESSVITEHVACKRKKELGDGSIREETA
jgi:hypothetical protein